jgi:hypothetical protein
MTRAFDRAPLIAGLPGDLRPDGPGLSQRLNARSFIHLSCVRIMSCHRPAHLVGPYRPQDVLTTDELVLRSDPTRDTARPTTYEGIRGETCGRGISSRWRWPEVVPVPVELEVAVPA